MNGLEHLNPHAIMVNHKVYPGIGRMLTQDDLNKQVVRVYPKGDNYSFVPLRVTDVAGSVLKVLEQDRIVVGNEELNAYWIDNNWLTVPEFIAKTRYIEPTILHTYDIDPPY